MPVYISTGPWSNGSSPGLSAAFLNAVETQLTATQYGMNILAAPYAVVINGTITGGSTTTYTCTGGATGVTTGAKAVFINVFFTPAAAGIAVRCSPHSTAWSASLYPEVGDSTGTSICSGSFFVPVDAGGQIDVKANGGNATGLYIGITGFVY